MNPSHLGGTTTSYPDWNAEARCVGVGFVLRLGCDVEIHRSARKHGITDRQINYALDHARLVADLDDETSPARTLVLGPDSAGNMLELIVLHFDDGRDMVIHAMPMRRQYESLLPREEPPT
jgi:hypothetical protein